MVLAKDERADHAEGGALDEVSVADVAGEAARVEQMVPASHHQFLGLELIAALGALLPTAKQPGRAQRDRQLCKPKEKIDKVLLFTCGNRRGSRCATDGQSKTGPFPVAGCIRRIGGTRCATLCPRPPNRIGR